MVLSSKATSASELRWRFLFHVDSYRLNAITVCINSSFFSRVNIPNQQSKRPSCALKLLVGMFRGLQMLDLMKLRISRLRNGSQPRPLEGVMEFSVEQAALLSAMMSLLTVKI